ncbi:MAG: metallophosphoesterase [Bacillus sp. (in: firmicutes)]
MNILVVSDSHGQTEDLFMLQDKYRHKAEAMFHCGDSELQKGHPALEGFQYVRGNCDYDAAFPEHVNKEVGGYRFLMTHGHLYNIGMTLDRLSYKAEETGADIVLFGHSHRPGSMQDQKGVLYINPGSISLPRGRKEKSYCLINIDGKQVSVRFFEPDGTELKSLEAVYQMN